MQNSTQVESNQESRCAVPRGPGSSSRRRWLMVACCTLLSATILGDAAAQVSGAGGCARYRKAEPRARMEPPPPVYQPAPAPRVDPPPRTVVLSADILFDYDKSVLKPEGKEALNRLVNDMRNNPNEQVYVEGHTCDLGSDAYNMSLSQRRANAVRTYMIEQGIASSLITTEAYGESRPAVPNTSEENRKLNRRAEFRFTTRQ